MKKTFLLIMILTSTFYLFAQDVIIRKNGDQINCTIIKVDSANIYFSMIRNGDKLNTIINKSEVQDIRYNVTNSSNLAQDGLKSNIISKHDTLPAFAIGLGTGINNYTAIFGLSANLRIYNKLSLQGGIGIGGWGNKYSIGIKYNYYYDGGWSYGFGYSVCPGENNIKANLQVTSGTTQQVTLNYLTASTVNLKVGRSWRIGQKNTFYMEYGYAIPIQSNPWKVTDNSVLSSTSISALKLIQPGGLIIGLGFTFGI
jgi:hypothetical protein